MTYRLQLYDHSGRPTRYRNYAETWAIVRDGREIISGAIDDLKDARQAVRELNEEDACHE